MREWLLTRKTKHQFTAPYTSAHNGRVEHLHHTLMGKACTMRISCNIPTNRWDEFILTVAYLSNRTPVTSQAGHTPYEKWYSRKPNLSHLQEIRCQTFVLIQKCHNPKIFNCSTECILGIRTGKPVGVRGCTHTRTHRNTRTPIAGMGFVTGMRVRDPGYDPTRVYLWVQVE